MRSFFLIISLVVSSCASLDYPVPDPDYRNLVKSREREQINRDDELEKRIETAIENVFVNDDYELSLEVFNNKVYLIGVVYKEELRSNIHQFVMVNFGSSEKIVNLITYRVAKDSWMGFSDFDLSNKIRTALNTTNKLDTSALDYKVYDKVVYVYGYATKKQLDTFGAIASRVSGVVKVVVLCEMVDSSYINTNTHMQPYDEVVNPPVSSTPPKSKSKEAQEITPASDIPKINETTSGDPAKETLPNQNGDVLFK